MDGDFSDTQCIIDTEDKWNTSDTDVNDDDSSPNFTSSKLVFHSDHLLRSHSLATDQTSTSIHHFSGNDSSTNSINTGKHQNEEKDTAAGNSEEQSTTIAHQQVKVSIAKQHDVNHATIQVGSENKEDREGIRSSYLDIGITKSSGINNNNTSLTQDNTKDDDLEIVVIPCGNEMKLDGNAAPDFYQDDQILYKPTLENSSYRHLLKLCGFIGSDDSLLTSHHQDEEDVETKSKKSSFVMLYIYRCILLVFIITVWLIKFDGLIRLKLVVLEKKFPFTVLNNLIWELRWILTYLLCFKMVSDGGLKTFLSQLEITHKQWRQNKKKMRYYIILVSLIIIIAPVIMIILDVNWLNLNRVDNISPTIWENFLLALFILFYRLIMTPSFCILSAMLFLLGDHIHMAGKRMNRQKTFKEAHNVVQRMRKLIRDTEKSLQLIIVVHMLLVFCASFTTAMSTLERLEFTYSTQHSGNSTMVKIKIVDTPSGGLAKPLPLSDLIILKSQLNEMKSHIDRFTINPRQQEDIGLSSQINGLLSNNVNEQLPGDRQVSSSSEVVDKMENNEDGNGEESTTAMPKTTPEYTVITTENDNMEDGDATSINTAKNIAKVTTTPMMSTTVVKAEDIQRAYQLMTNMQQQQIKVMEKMMKQQNANKQQNRTVVASASGVGQPTSVDKVLSTIPANFNTVKTLIDMMMLLVEVLLLYMAPLFLIVRTDYQLREFIPKTWDINIEDQIERDLAIITCQKKEHILAHVKDTEGLRVCGYRVEFFKTLILASFGPFLAIALRSTLKHYGF